MENERNWIEQPPTNQTEINDEHRAVLCEIAHYLKGDPHPSAFPPLKHLETPYTIRRPSTGMRKTEYDIVSNHIIRNAKRIMACWLNYPVAAPEAVKYAFDIDIDPKYLYSYIPRLDALLVTWDPFLVAVEHNPKFTASLLGEVDIKASIYTLLHPNHPPWLEAHILTEEPNPLLINLTKPLAELSFIPSWRIFDESKTP